MVSNIEASYKALYWGTIRSCLCSFPRGPPSVQDIGCLSDSVMIKRGLSVPPLKIGSLSESLRPSILGTMAFGFCITQQYRPLYIQQHVLAALIVSIYSNNLTYYNVSLTLQVAFVWMMALCMNQIRVAENSAVSTL